MASHFNEVLKWYSLQSNHTIYAVFNINSKLCYLLSDTYDITSRRFNNLNIAQDKFDKPFKSLQNKYLAVIQHVKQPL